jgi:hypothetical protein
MKNKAEDLPHAKSWNYRLLIGCFFVGVLGQAIFLPCLCAIGNAKMAFAGIFDSLVLIRCIIAYSRKEKGNGWIFYAALIVTSPAWIEAGAWITFKET